MKKSIKNVSRKAALFAWMYVLWCDITTLGRYDLSWRAIALRFLCIGLGCILCGVIFLAQGIVSMHPSTWIFGAIILGFGLVAFLIGLTYRNGD